MSEAKKIALDGSICTGCGVCAQVCPESVFSIDMNRACIAMPDVCTGCGVCVEKCLPRR